MELAELHAVSDELQVMRRQAFDEGYKQAVEELNTQIADIHAAQEENARHRNEWAQVMANVQAAYLLHHEKKMESTWTGLTSRYQTRMTLPADMDEFAGEMTRLVQMGKDFDVLLRHIKTNEILKGAWNKVLVAMRLIQE